MQITIGSRVTVHFSLKLAGGMTVESSFDNEPVTFRVGDGTLDRGLELALIGLRGGDHQTLTLMPGQAFGRRDENAVQWVDRTQFPHEMELQPGHIVGFAGPDGEELAAAVLEVRDDQVRVDFNHPLAGREIEFESQILRVDEPPEGEDFSELSGSSD
ncbi:MAG: FKBP-type peptidyl-prolyl cis-trans isomerase [Gammaproteobacteria bacterium]|jgi:FKBP-type peptidyl-prolyl cis-trans isomerase SlpA